MRLIKRPFVATSAAVLLALSFSACGGDGDEKASEDTSSETTESSDSSSDASTAEFCEGISEIIAVSSAVTGEQPDEEEWIKIQQAYADLGEAGPPDDIPETEKEGFEIAVETVTTLSFAEAEEAFGDEDGSDALPGVSAEDNAKAEAFFSWSATACPELSGGAPTE